MFAEVVGDVASGAEGLDPTWQVIITVLPPIAAAVAAIANIVLAFIKPKTEPTAVDVAKYSVKQTSRRMKQLNKSLDALTATFTTSLGGIQSALGRVEGRIGVPPKGTR